MDHIAPALIDSAPVPNVTPALVVRHDEDYVRLRRTVETRAAHHRVENHARKTLPTGGVSTRTRTTTPSRPAKAVPTGTVGRGASIRYRYSTGKKTPGGAGTHTGHTGTHGHTDHTDEPHNSTGTTVQNLPAKRHRAPGVAGTHMGRYLKTGRVRVGARRGDRLEDTGGAGTHTGL